MPSHLQPTAAIAADAVLTGDPKRAMELATAVTERPLMSNLARGLWGYHGRTDAGTELSVNSTGIGGPSTALVIRELHEHGVRRAIRVGTATALDGRWGLGAGLAIGEAVCLDGTSQALLGVAGGGGGEPGRARRVRPAASFAAALADSPDVAPGAVVASLDLPPDLATDGPDSLRAGGIGLADLSTAAFLAQAAALGIEAAAIVVVTAVLDGEDLAIEAADAACLEAGRLAARVLLANRSGAS